MTDNIQKLYEITGVYLCNMPDVDCSKECGKCEDYNPFTAEKQLELIKYLANIETIATQFDGGDYQVLTESNFGNWCKTFEQALASLTLELWQDLTDNQKQQIKEILQ